MNYFEFYNLPVSFSLDEDLLKKKYFELSKKYHPDYHLQSSDDEQAKILELSSLNNIAYQTLLNSDSRIEYVLELKGMIVEGEKYELSKDFLMEMMEMNEQLMELELENDKQKINEIKIRIETFENELFDSVRSIIEHYSDLENNNQQLIKVKDFYYKKKYLSRLKESLNKFQT